MDLTKLTIEEAHNGLKNKEFSAFELSSAYLDKIEKEDDKINAFLSADREGALKQARKMDKRIFSGEITALTGIPVAIKDNILVKGLKNTCASKILENYIAPYDATVIEKLKKEGVVILGKTNMDEFAMGSSTENSAFGATKNPHDLERVPGGSSGGSAAATAADFCCFALGSDTGGSIRQPASFCGVVGLKPTYGSVSRYGLVAFASSLDQIGTLTKTIEDSQIVFETISGKDIKDSTSIDFKTNNSEFKIKNLRIGVPKEYFVEGVDPEIKGIIEQSIKQLKNQGARLVDISLPNTKYALPAYYIIASSEASANLSRYDGIKFGLSEDREDLLGGYLKTKEKGFGDEVKRRIMIGTYALSSGYYDAYYLKAQKVRTLIKQDFYKAFEKVDAIFTPTTPTPAFKIGEKVDPLSMYLSDIFTVSVNLAGLPAVSVPVGFTGAKPASQQGGPASQQGGPASQQGGPASQQGGLPAGLQIIGKPFEENKILNIAKIYTHA